MPAKQGAARKYLLAALVVAVVAGLVTVGVTPLGAPRPQPAGAPATAFSAARALVELRGVAAAPHPIGSQAESEVRATIVARLQALGLSPHVQTAGVVSQEDGRVAGTVRNILARLPGSDPARSVLLVAHYDSVAVAPGAADDGSGVATLLETARALSAGPLPRNDIVFLFTDGEEKGLLGARAFLRDDPWAYGVGVVLNFDSPGSSSPALMYETTSGNGMLVRTLLDAGPPVFASSLMYEVARRQPVETDFRRFKAAGVPGMSFGALDGPADDHTGYDSLHTFRLASLQHEGDTALALARRFGAIDLWNLHAPDRVYFDIVGGLRGLLRGRARLAARRGRGGALHRGRRRRLAPPPHHAARRRRRRARIVARARPSRSPSSASSGACTGRPTSSACGPTPASWSATSTAWGWCCSPRPSCVAAYGLLLRRLSPWDLAVAALFWWLAAAAVLAVAIPTAAYLLTWPLAAASLGLLVAALLGERVLTSAWVLVPLAAAAPGVVLLSSAGYLLLMSAGLKTMATVLVVWFVVGLLLLPLAVARRGFRWWLPAGLAVAGAVVLVVVASSAVVRRRPPQVHQRLLPAGRPRRGALGDHRPRERLDAPVPAATSPGTTTGCDYFPGLGDRYTISTPATGDHLPPPEIRVLSDAAEGDRRTVTVRVRPRRPAAVLSVLEESVVGSLTASVDGRPLQSRDTTILDATPVRWYFDYYAPPARGVVLTLRCQAGRPLTLRAVDYSYGLPAGGGPGPHAAAAGHPARLDRRRHARRELAPAGCRRSVRRGAVASRAPARAAAPACARPARRRGARRSRGSRRSASCPGWRPARGR